jgi:predicted alpha/beta superfamily hydrolase
VQYNLTALLQHRIQSLMPWMLLLCVISCPAGATPQDYNPGYDLAVKHYLSLYSSVLHERRSIEIVVPPDYKKDSPAGYDVIYVLDGIRAYHFVAYDYLRGEGFLPSNTIMVGLLGIRDANTRRRDFTPTGTPPDAGGAKSFLQFLKSELIPHIDKVYHTSSARSTLVGGSLGGLFVMYAFLNEPSLCKAYIALDPSLWWDNGYLNTLAGERVSNLKDLHRVLWIDGREGQAYREMGVAQMEATLQAKAPTDLTWKCVAYPNETHLTTWIKGFWDGLKFCYGGYYRHGIGFKPADGIVLKDRPFKLWCYQLLASSYIRYTLDGATPTPASPNLSAENTFRFEQDTRLTIKSFSPREEYNVVASGNFKVGAALPAIAKPEGIQPGGLRYAYYEGAWDRLPDFSKLKQDRSGLAGRDFGLSQFPRRKTFACLLQGYLEIRKPGYYIFELGDEGGSRVYLGDLRLIGDHYDGAGGSTFMAPLEQGFYPFRVEYFHRKGGQDLAPVYIKPEAQEDFPIPLELLYSRKG